jgi:hypothetical protein
MCRGTDFNCRFALSNLSATRTSSIKTRLETAPTDSVLRHFRESDLFWSRRSRAGSLRSDRETINLAFVDDRDVTMTAIFHQL